MSSRLRLGTVGRRTVLCDEKTGFAYLYLHFCRRACFLFSNLMSESVAVIRLSGYPRSIRLALKCEILVLNFFSEEFVRGSLTGQAITRGQGAISLRS